MDYALFIKTTEKRNRFVYAWLASTSICVLLEIALMVVHNNSDALWALILSILLLTAIIVESIILLSLAFSSRRKSYDLFQNNTIIINKDTAKKLRKTDQYALKNHEGNLKQALQHLATTPDLTRAERMDYIIEWHDYERDFITQQYGAMPHRVAKASRKLPLYANGEEYVRAVCVRKYTTPSTDTSSSEAMLDFGSHGTWEVNEPHLYYFTEAGDEFYLLKSSDRKSIIQAYSLLDWEFIESTAE